jgi:SAM-dependent methyltransferase
VIATQSRAVAVRMFKAMLATQELLSTYLGVRLGLYEELASGGPATAAGLAVRAAIAPRYAREWLEQQAVAGLLAVDDTILPADERVYSLPEDHVPVLTLSDDPLSMVSLTTLPLGGVACALPRLLTAYRTGEGVPDEAFGDDWRDGHSGANRALFAHSLVRWIQRFLPEVDLRLRAGGRVADVACGAGWAGIALARAYPGASVTGLDVDARTLAAARENAAACGVADRVTFEVRDAADRQLTGPYDLVCLFDALHEMGRPVQVLRSCRRLSADGSVLVMDARVANAFDAPGDEVERFQYATSLLHCLPAGLAEQPSEATGTVLRVDSVRAQAAAAGFTRVEVIPIGDRFHRLYWMVT